MSSNKGNKVIIRLLGRRGDLPKRLGSVILSRMPQSKPRAAYQLEFIVAGGQVVIFEVSMDEALAHALKRGPRSDDLTEREYAIRGLITVIFDRLEKGAGYFTSTDVDGRFWIIPAVGVLAASVKDLVEPGTRRVGFDPGA
jgi:hypothetical protein